MPFAKLARFNMKTPSSLLWIALALGMGVVAFTVSGCGRRPTPVAETPPPAVSPTPTPAPVPAAPVKPAAPVVTRTPEQDAVQVVTDYLTALDKGEYTTAHRLLSKESQSQHSLADFTKQAKGGGDDPVDLQGAKVTQMTKTTAVVSVPTPEDPAPRGFTLAREQGQWRIVYRVGVPRQPYPGVPGGEKKEMPNESHPE